MKFGIFFAYWEKNWVGDYLRYLKKAKDIGLDVLEISPGSLLDMNCEQLTEIRRMSEDLGVELSTNLGPPKQYDLSSSDAAVRAAGLDFQTRILDVMEQIGSRKLCGALHSCWPYDFIDLDKKARLDRGIESISKLARRAEDKGIDLCIEILNRFEDLALNTAQEGVDFVKSVDSPNAKILLDTFHMNIEENDIIEAIHIGGPYLGHVHVGERNRRLPCAKSGSLDWAAIGRALNEENYKDYVVAEPFVTVGGQIAKDIKVWRDLSDNADEAKLDSDARAYVNFLREAFKA